MHSLRLLVLICLLAGTALTGCDRSTSLSTAIGASDRRDSAALYQRYLAGDSDAKAELEQRATSSDSYSAFYAGLANDPGLAHGAASSPVRAAQFYERAGQTLSAARHNLGLLLLGGVTRGNQPDVQSAVALLEDAAHDHVESMLVLAALYRDGWPGITPDPARSAEWLERAVKYTKDPRAEAALGAVYQDGFGRARNPELAQRYLLSAAKAGESSAQYRLALWESDPIRRAQWLTVAAMSDRRYKAQAEQSQAILTEGERREVVTNARLWVHAHSDAEPQRRAAYAAPLSEP